MAVEFEGVAQQRYATQHLMQAFKLFNLIGKGSGLIEFHEYFTRDPYYRLVVNKEGLAKVVDDWWNTIRLTFNKLEVLYDEEMQGWYNTYEYNPKKGETEWKINFGKKRLDEWMFSDEVLNLDMNRRMGETDQKKRERWRARNAFPYFIGKELLVHRKWDSQAYRYSYEMVEAIEEFFRQHPLEIEVIDKNGKTDVEVIKGFFDKYEWKQIAKMGKATLLDFTMDDIGMTAPALGLGMLFKGFSKFIEVTAKGA